MEQENTPPHIPPPSKNAATSVSNRVSEGISKATKFNYLLFYSFKHTETRHIMKCSWIFWNANIGFSLWITLIFIHVKGRTGHRMTVIWSRMEAFGNLYLVSSFPSSFPFQVLYLTHFFFPFLRNLQRSEKRSLVTKWCRNRLCPQLRKDLKGNVCMCVNGEVLNVLTTQVQVHSLVFLLCLRALVSNTLIGL